MLRVSAACEKAGIPAVTIVCEGFARQAKATSRGLGFAALPLSVMPGHTGVQSPDEIRHNVRQLALAQVVEGLLRTLDQTADTAEARSGDCVFTGTFDQVNEYFYAQGWSDGLPIVPPTIEKVKRFLAFTDRDPFETLAILLPDDRRATPWNIAVNGVMAGCLPEYMPVLMALVEAMSDPAYGVEHSGNTPGSETLIILNGPIIKQLGFNYEQGVMRDGVRANTSIGRFWRLYLRNVAGFKHGTTDKGTFGGTWRVVLAENEDAVAAIGWEPQSVDMGFATGDNVVTIGRYSGGNVIASVSGSTPETLLPYIADRILKEHSWQLTFTMGSGHGKLRPLLLLTPVLAETVAKAGWSKADLKQYLFDHVRIPAWEFERYVLTWMDQGYSTLTDAVAQGLIPEVFAESDDPQRLVPIVFAPDHFMVVVSGDPLRTNAYVFSHNGIRGFTVAKKIQLPKNWESLRPHA